MKARLAPDAVTHEDALRYLEARSIQLLRFGVDLQRIEFHEQALRAILNLDGKKYQSVYLLAQHRGKGAYLDLVAQNDAPILTAEECELETYLHSKRVPFKSFQIGDIAEYKAVQDFYGDQTAKRSGVYLMNHIDEGRAVLKWIGASSLAHQGFCLHPLIQNDADLIQNYRSMDRLATDATTPIITMEYRSVANGWLSKRTGRSYIEPQMPVLPEVRDMLIADKVQNRKDFELYHEGTHPRSDELAAYFKAWLEALEVREETYQDYKRRLTLDYERVSKQA